MILQPYDVEVGAGTLHPATVLRALGPKPWRVAYVQPSRRPADGRYGENPNRLQQLPPVPGDPEAQPGRHAGRSTWARWRRSASTRRCTTSASSRTTGRTPPSAPGASAGRSGATGWRSPSTPTSSRSAASTSFPVAGELTYGLERLALYVQGVDNVYDLAFNDPAEPRLQDLWRRVPGERARSSPPSSWRWPTSSMLKRQFEDMEREVPRLLAAQGPPGPAAGAAGLRPRAEGLAPVQPDGRARRDRGGRAARATSAASATSAKRCAEAWVALDSGGAA